MIFNINKMAQFKQKLIDEMLFSDFCQTSKPMVPFFFNQGGKTESKVKANALSFFTEIKQNSKIHRDPQKSPDSLVA